MAQAKNTPAVVAAENNPLAAIVGQVAPSSLMTQNVVDDMLKSSFLPRLQVSGASSEAVKTEKVPMGTWSIVYDKDRIKDMGKELDILVLAFRPQALRLPKNGNPVAYFNREHPEFKKIMAESKIKDSGCLYGLQFLVWVPGVGFATMYLGSWSGRKQAPAVLAEMKKNPDGSEREQHAPNTVTLRIGMDTNREQKSWHSPRFFPCTSALRSYPDAESLQNELTTFNNPPEGPVIEKVDEKDKPAGEAARAR